MNRSDLNRSIVLGAALVLSIALARAADDLPKAETLLDKYIEVTGGKAAYQKHHSEIQKGTLEFSAMGGMKGTMIAYKVAPDKSYQEVDLPGLGKNRIGSDGKVFWAIIPMVGPHVQEGVEKAQAKLSARFNPDLNWRELFKEVKTTGVDTVDGKECYKVVLTPPDSSAITQCYDKESSLMVKITVTAEGPMGSQTVDSFATDYRKEGDILMAHKLKQSLPGVGDVTTNIESVTFDVEIPADKFEIPDEIKALVNKK